MKTGAPWGRKGFLPRNPEIASKVIRVLPARCTSNCSVLRNGGDLWGAGCWKVWSWLQGKQRASHSTRGTVIWREKSVYLSSLCVWRWADGDPSGVSLEVRKLTQWLCCFICMNLFLGSLYWSAQAARTKCHSLSDLNNRNLFLTILEAGKSMIRVPANLTLGESSLPGLQMPSFSRCPHVAFPQCVWRSLSSSSSYKATFPIMRAPPSWTTLTVITS